MCFPAINTHMLVFRWNPYTGVFFLHTYECMYSSPCDDMQLCRTSHTHTNAHTRTHKLLACVYKQPHRHTNTETIRQTIITAGRPTGHMAASRAELRYGLAGANAPLAWSVPETQCTGGQPKEGVTVCSSAKELQLRRTQNHKPT